MQNSICPSRPIKSTQMNKNNFILTSVFLLLVLTGISQVKLPAIFSDHMVLQCDSEVPVWGTAGPGKKVTLQPSWTKAAQVVTAGSDGKWKVRLKTPSAGEIHSLVICDGQPIKISDILMGEVWLCSGQSNMTMPLKGFPNDPVKGGMEEIVNSPDNNIRLFDVGRSTH